MTKKAKDQSMSSSLEDDFAAYLQQENVVFFTGKFGSGKTSFLQQFFRERQEQYHVVSLHLVDYQMYSDEEIVDLIKYDVLTALLKYDGPKKAEQDAQKQEEWRELLLGTLIWGWIKSAVESVPFLSQLSKQYNELEVLAKEYGSYQKDSLKHKEKKLVEELQNRISNLHRTTHGKEYGFLARKLREQTGTERQSVLVIDDLDGLDPTHIFRILNILTAHGIRQEKDGGGNVFCFDKVILVGDINNIEKIFHHQYGDDSDFAGYIDKFTAKTYDFEKRVSSEVSE